MSGRCFSLGVLLLLGCASAPDPSAAGQTPRVEETSTGMRYELGAATDPQRSEIAASPDSVWGALVHAYGELGLQPDIIDPQARRYGVRRFTGSQIGGRRVAEYVRCSEGAGPSAVVGMRTELTIVSTVRSHAAGALLETAVSGFARRVDGTSTPPVRCETNGDLERRIATAVHQRLGR